VRFLILILFVLRQLKNKYLGQIIRTPILYYDIIYIAVIGTIGIFTYTSSEYMVPVIDYNLILY